MGNMKSFDVRGNLGIVASPNNRDTYNKYLHEIIKLKPLSREEEAEIFKQIKLTNNQALKDKICKHNLAFVVSVAKKYAIYIKKSTLTLEDLISEGNMGLYRAIDKFDTSLGLKFISYAVWHIRAQILKSINENIKSVRVPMNIQNTLSKLLREEAKLEQKLGNAVDTEELFREAKRLGILEKTDEFGKIMSMMGNVKSDKSLSDLVSDDGTMEFSETIVSQDETPEESTENKELKNLIYKLFETVPTIPVSAKNYIIDYYGLYGKSIVWSHKKVEHLVKSLKSDIIKLKGQLSIEEKRLSTIKNEYVKDNTECKIEELKRNILSLTFEIKRLKRERLTYKEIGEKYDRGSERVRQIVEKWLRRIRYASIRNKNDEYFRNNY